MVDRRVSILAVLEDKLSRPLANIRRRFSRVERGVGSLTRSLLPLNAQLVTIATGLAGIGGGRQALELGERQVRSEQALLAALKDRTSELERIKAVASEIQSETITGDEALLETAALLTRMGVEAERIPQALRVAQDTATSLNASLPLVARGIARAITQGQAGLLGRRVPFLQSLLDDGASAIEILDALEDSFGGAGAAFAEGPFGQAESLSNEIGDNLEEIGKVLINFVVPVLDVVNDKLGRFVTFLGDERVQVFLRFAERLALVLTAAAGALAGLVTAAAAITILGPGLGFILSVVSAVASIVGGIIAGVGVIPAILAIIVARVGVLTGLWSRIKDAVLSSTSGIRGSLGQIIELFKAVTEGRADFEELFAFVGSKLAILKLQLEKFILLPITAIFTAAKDLAKGTIDTIFFGALLATNKFADKFLDTIQFIINAAVEGFNAIGFDFSEVSFGDELNDEVEEFRDKFIEAADFASSAISRAFATLKGELALVNAEITDERLRAANILATAEERAFDRAKEAILASGAAGAEKIAQLDSLIATSLQQAGGIDLNIDNLFENLDTSSVRTALDGLSTDSQAALTTVIQAEIERRYDAEELRVAEVFALRRTLLDATTKDEVDAVESALDAENKKLELLREQQALGQDYLSREQKTLSAQEGAEKSVEDRRKTLTRIGEIQDGLLENAQNQAITAERIFQLEEERAAALINRAAAEQQVEGERRSLAEAIVAEVEEARSTLEKKRQEIANQVLTGEILPSAGVKLSQDALDEFNEVADAAVLELEALAGKQTEVQEAFANTAISVATFGLVLSVTVDGATEKLNDLIEKVVELQGRTNDAAPEGGFWTGLENGITRTANVLGNFGIQGERIGAKLIEDFGKGLVDVWSDNEKSFSDFSKTFIANAAKMIAQMLVFKAISTTLGAFGFGTEAAPEGATGGLFTGGSFLHFAGGGAVPGPWTMRDTVNAKLMPGEYVHDFNTTRYYGLNWMSAMKKRLIPRQLFPGVSGIAPTPQTRFEDGGPVMSSGSSGGGTGRSVVVPDEQSFDRMLRGGTASLQEVLEELGFRPAV